MSCSVYAGSIVPSSSITEGTMSSDTASVSSYQVITKDGEGTVTVTENVSKKYAVYVREGELLVGDSDAQVTLNVTPSATNNPSSPYMPVIVVAGKNTGDAYATLVLDNAKLDSGHEATVIVGSADGNGALVLDNGAVTNPRGHMQTMIIGELKDNAVGAYTTDEDGNRYQGSYVSAANGSGAEFGRGVVTVKNNSTLNTGYQQFYMSEGELNAIGTGSADDKTTVNIGGTWGTYTILGCDANSTSVINVTNGAEVNVRTVGFYTGFDGSNDSSVFINVDGSESKFTVAATTPPHPEVPNSASPITTVLGFYSGASCGKPQIVSATELKATNGGVIDFQCATTMLGYGDLSEGSSVVIDVDKESTLKAQSVYMYKGTQITNEGNASIAALNVWGGEMNNAGELSVESVSTSGGVLNNSGNMSAGTISVTAGGVLDNSGTIKATQILVYDNQRLNMTFGNDADGDAAPITVTDTGEFAFYMGGGSTLGLSFTDDYITELLEEQGGCSFSFKELVVQGNRTTGNSFDLGNMDERFWVLTSSEWIQEGNLHYVSGTVTYNEWAEIESEDELTEVFADFSERMPVGLIFNKGDVLISGNNSYSSGSVVDGVKVTVGHENALGSGKVTLKNHAVLDLAGFAVKNPIVVEGCTLMRADNYSGDLAVHHALDIVGPAKANKISLIGAGALTGDSVTVNELDVQTDDNASVGGSLTVNPNGTITLNNGKVLFVGGSLTLEGNTTLVLNGDYEVGTKLLTSTGALTIGNVTLVCDDSLVLLEQQGNSLVLESVFSKKKANALTVSNWGIATASRAMVNAVRGQRSNTGCIADGKGTAWVAILGGNNDINGSDISLSGAALGADMQVGAASRVGIAMGYVEGEVRPSGLRQVDQEGSYIAAYGEHGLKKLSSTSCLSMDWVAAYGVTDSEGAGQKWEQDSVQLNSRVNWNKKVNDKLCMSVFGGLEYFANNSDTVAGVKTGSIQNLRGEIGVGARYVAWGAPAATASYDEKGAMLTEARPGCEKLVLNGEIRYMNDMVRSNPVIRMEGLSGMGENPGRQGMGIEAGATYRIGERWSASANYGFNTMEDSKEHRVNVGAAYTF